MNGFVAASAASLKCRSASAFVYATSPLLFAFEPWTNAMFTGTSTFRMSIPNRASEDVGHAVLRIGVVPGPLVREEHARVRRFRFERGQPVFGVHQDRRGIRRQRLRHRGLEFGERFGRTRATLLSDLAHQRTALIHR